MFIMKVIFTDDVNLGPVLEKRPVAISQKSRNFTGPSMLFGLISAATISFTSLQQRRSKQSHFTVLIVFSYSKNMLKDQPFKTSGSQG